MKNMYKIVPALFILLVFSLSVASAHTEGYYDSYSYTSSRTYGDYYGYSYTKSQSYQKTTDTKLLPYGGYEKTTTYKKTVKETPEYNYRYYGGYSGDYDSSYWRYKPVYNYIDYGPDRYPKTYYYQPKLRYEGYYNWRY